jgi:hypothetical protein
VHSLSACHASLSSKSTAEYLDNQIADSWELMKQNRNALRPHIAGGIVPPIGEARQFGRVV